MSNSGLKSSNKVIRAHPRKFIPLSIIEQSVSVNNAFSMENINETRSSSTNLQTNVVNAQASSQTTTTQPVFPTYRFLSLRRSPMTQTAQTNQLGRQLIEENIFCQDVLNTESNFVRTGTINLGHMDEVPPPYETIVNSIRI